MNGRLCDQVENQMRLSQRGSRTSFWSNSRSTTKHFWHTRFLGIGMNCGGQALKSTCSGKKWMHLRSLECLSKEEAALSLLGKATCWCVLLLHGTSHFGHFNLNWYFAHYSSKPHLSLLSTHFSPNLSFMKQTRNCFSTSCQSSSFCAEWKVAVCLLFVYQNCQPLSARVTP